MLAGESPGQTAFLVAGVVAAIVVVASSRAASGEPNHKTLVFQVPPDRASA